MALLSLLLLLLLLLSLLLLLLLSLLSLLSLLLSLLFIFPIAAQKVSLPREATAGNQKKTLEAGEDR
jgi:uncharacterized protein (DUF58 family)